MKLDLQFFGDGDDTTGAEVEQGTAEPVEIETGTETAESEEGAEPVNETSDEGKIVDINAIYANARRKAEKEMKERQAKDDAEFARRFGNYKNPITGKPIQTQADYFAALDAEKQMKAENELRNAGVNPSLINELILNNPAIKQANEVIRQSQEQQVMNDIAREISEIGVLNPNIKSFEDVPREVVEMSMQKNYSLVEAYKLYDYGRWTSDKANATRQQAINQIKGKDHLKPVDGVATTEKGVDIPQSELSDWREAYPNLSMAELRKKYNRVLNNN